MIKKIAPKALSKKHGVLLPKSKLALGQKHAVLFKFAR